MNMVVEPGKPLTASVQSLNIGDAFELSNHYYIKTNRGDSSLIMCVDLVSGHLVDVVAHREVTVLPDATLYARPQLEG